MHPAAQQAFPANSFIWGSAVSSFPSLAPCDGEGALVPQPHAGPAGVPPGPPPSLTLPQFLEDPPRRFYSFAHIQNLGFAIAQLAEMARAEVWGDENSNHWRSRFRILLSYVTHTYRFLSHRFVADVHSEGPDNEGGIFVTALDPSTEIACFNTGLVTATFFPIFGVFLTNPMPNKQRFSFCAWMTADRVFQQFPGAFPNLPNTRPYTHTASDLVFDWRVEVDLNADFLVTCNHTQLQRLFPDHSRAQLIAEVEASLEITHRILRTQALTPVPQYFHDRGAPRGQVQLLLPFFLQSDLVVPAFAIPVSKKRRPQLSDINASGGYGYTSRTLLALPAAYCNARLLQRVESAWLRVELLVHAPFGGEDDGTEGGDDFILGGGGGGGGKAAGASSNSPPQLVSDEVRAGVVVRFENTFGFIEPDDGSPALFAHYTEINSQSDFKELKKGERVSFQVAIDNGRARAVNINPLQRSFLPSSQPACPPPPSPFLPASLSRVHALPHQQPLRGVPQVPMLPGGGHMPFFAHQAPLPPSMVANGVGVPHQQPVSSPLAHHHPHQHQHHHHHHPALSSPGPMPRRSLSFEQPPPRDNDPRFFPRHPPPLQSAGGFGDEDGGGGSVVGDFARLRVGDGGVFVGPVGIGSAAWAPENPIAPQVSRQAHAGAFNNSSNSNNNSNTDQRGGG